MATKGKVRDILKILRNDGWYEVKSNSGDHRQFKHARKPGKVTVDGKPSDEMRVKTWDTVLRQAGLK